MRIGFALLLTVALLYVSKYNYLLKGVTHI